MAREFYRNEGGQILRNVDGSLMKAVESCCFYQALSCDDDSPADVWIKKSEVTSKPIYFEITAAPGTRYYIPADAVATVCPGTVYAIADVTTYEGCSGGTGYTCWACWNCCFSDATKALLTIPTFAGGADAVLNAAVTAVSGMTTSGGKLLLATISRGTSFSGGVTYTTSITWSQTSTTFTVSGQTYRVTASVTMTCGSPDPVTGDYADATFAISVEQLFVDPDIGDTWSGYADLAAPQAAAADKTCCSCDFPDGWYDGSSGTPTAESDVIEITFTGNKCCDPTGTGQDSAGCVKISTNEDCGGTPCDRLCVGCCSVYRVTFSGSAISGGPLTFDLTQTYYDANFGCYWQNESGSAWMRGRLMKYGFIFFAIDVDAIWDGCPPEEGWAVLPNFFGAYPDATVTVTKLTCP